MTVRTPLYTTSSGDLREMSASDITKIKKQAIYLLNGGWNSLSVRSSGGIQMLQSVVPWQFRSGSGDGKPGGSDYPAVPSSLSYDDSTYARLVIDKGSSTSAPSDSGDVAFPLFYDGAHVQAMDLDDFIDTFCKPAIVSHVNQSSGYEGRHWIVSTNSNLSGYDQVDWIYQDWYAGLYPGGGSEPSYQLRATYYLHRSDRGPSQSYTKPCQATTSGDVRAYSTSAFNNLLEKAIKYTASRVNNYRVDYQLESGTSRPSGASDSTRMGTTIIDRARPANESTTATATRLDLDLYYKLRYANGSLRDRRQYNLYIRRY